MQTFEKEKDKSHNVRAETLGYVVEAVISRIVYKSRMFRGETGREGLDNTREELNILHCHSQATRRPNITVKSRGTPELPSSQHLVTAPCM